MAQDYDNKNTGAFFKNDRKETASHPDYKGSINVDGVEYWLSGWIRPTRANPEKRFISLSIQPKQQKATAPHQAPARPAPSHDAARSRQVPRGTTGSGFDDIDSDVPF